MWLGLQPLESGARVCTFSVQETWTFGREAGCVFGLKGHLATEDMKTKGRRLGRWAGGLALGEAKEEGSPTGA